MKKIALAAALGLATLAAQASDIGVSVSIGQPGFYGRIDIGQNMPPPRYYNTQPVIIERVPVRVAPIYLRVPPGHQKDWRKHCHRYDACGVPVYFVRDDWYEREYVPVYRERYEREQGGWRDEDRGRGKGHGRGHGHGRD